VDAGAAPSIGEPGCGTGAWLGDAEGALAGGSTAGGRLADDGDTGCATTLCGGGRTSAVCSTSVAACRRRAGAGGGGDTVPDARRIGGTLWTGSAVDDAIAVATGAGMACCVAGAAMGVGVTGIGSSKTGTGVVTSDVAIWRGCGFASGGSAGLAVGAVFAASVAVFAATSGASSAGGAARAPEGAATGCCGLMLMQADSADRGCDTGAITIGDGGGADGRVTGTGSEAVSRRTVLRVCCAGTGAGAAASCDATGLAEAAIAGPDRTVVSAVFKAIVSAIWSPGCASAALPNTPGGPGSFAGSFTSATDRAAAFSAGNTGVAAFGGGVLVLFRSGTVLRSKGATAGDDAMLCGACGSAAGCEVSTGGAGVTPSVADLGKIVAALPSRDAKLETTRAACGLAAPGKADDCKLAKRAVVSGTRKAPEKPFA